MTLTQTAPVSNRVPVSIITGYLGSGKTTLLNNLVRQPDMDSVALIINEFGEIGLDNLLVETSIENTLLLENGCICCSVRGDLIDTIGDLFAKARNGTIPDFSRILIETTGLADPAPIVNTLRNERGVADRCRMDSVVTLIDGVQGKVQAESYPEAKKQIALADVGLITKSDLLEGSEVSALKRFIQGINPTLDTMPIEKGEVPSSKLFEQDAAKILASANDHQVEDHHHSHDHDHPHELQHESVSSWSYTDSTPIDRDRLFGWLRMLYSLRASNMLRLKGILRLAGEQKPWLLQGVGPVLDQPVQMTAWPNDEETTRLVFIVNGLLVENLKASFQRHVLD